MSFLIAFLGYFFKFLNLLRRDFFNSFLGCFGILFYVFGVFHFHKTFWIDFLYQLAISI